MKVREKKKQLVQPKERERERERAPVIDKHKQGLQIHRREKKINTDND